MPAITKELILTFIKEFYGQQAVLDEHALKISLLDKAGAAINVVVDLPEPLSQQSNQLEAFLKNRLSHEDESKKYNIIISVTQKTEIPKKTIKKIIAIASGKGGVGKSTIAQALARTSTRMGLKTGLLDADIHGPSLPILFDLEGTRLYKHADNKLEPVTKDGLKLMSIGFLIPPEKAVIWRGPMVMGAIEQMYRETNWGDLDLLIVDLPPGTGDAQLTLAQKVPIDGVIMVTTPNKLALADVKRATDMFRKMDIPILGLIENMSHFHCSHCHMESPLFHESSYDGSLLDLPILAHLPFHVTDNAEYQNIITAILDRSS